MGYHEVKTNLVEEYQTWLGGEGKYKGIHCLITEARETAWIKILEQAGWGISPKSASAVAQQQDGFPFWLWPPGMHAEGKAKCFLCRSNEKDLHPKAAGFSHSGKYWNPFQTIKTAALNDMAEKPEDWTAVPRPKTCANPCCLEKIQGRSNAVWCVCFNSETICCVFF